jgi:hypothetical protein
MLSKLVSQVVVFGTPLIMVCLFIAFIGLFIYFNRRIDRVVDRVNTLSELVSVLQDLVNTPHPIQHQPPREENKVVHVPVEQSDKIVVSDGEEEEEEEEEEEDYVSSSEEEEGEAINLNIEEDDVEPTITITKMEHSPEPEDDVVDEPVVVEPIDDVVEPIDDVVTEDLHITEVEPGLIDDDMMSVVSMSAPNVIPEPQLEEICTNAVLKERFLSTNYRGYKVNQLRDLATELHLIKDKEASKLKKGELITFLDKTYVNLKN